MLDTRQTEGVRSRDDGSDRQDPSVARLILVVLAALVTVGVVVGLMLSWVGTSALRAAGLDDADPEPRQSGPAVTSTPKPSAPTAAPGDDEPTTPSSTRTRSTPTPSAGSLRASPATAGSFEQVTLSGRLPGVAPGTSLQVERREGGGWVPFPASTTTAASGSFSTFVALGQLGANVMRVVIPGTQRSTPTVTIRIS